MEAIEPVIRDVEPDLVLVPGDVNSTLAAGLVAAKLEVPVGHIEAGLRSWDRTMPEELNRILTDALSSLLFIHSPEARDNLLREGVAMVPQLSTVFPDMSVEDNLELGMYLVRDKARVRRRIDEIFDLFPRLSERRNQHAGLLSGGERRALEIGRSLMLDPRLLLMDEPSVGLSPLLVREAFEQLTRLRDEAKRKAGAKWDPKAFHRVLTLGAMPLTVLEQVVRERMG